MTPARALPNADYVGPWYAWWPGDPLPALPPLPGLAVAPADDDDALADLMAFDRAGLPALREAGNRPYLARLHGAPVACGWVTGTTLDIGELGLVRALPAGARYLWGFVTGEAWRGRGIYPRLLQSIMRREGMDEARYWVGHTPDNAASARGILRAGFGRVGHVYRRPVGAFVLVPTGPRDWAEAGAAILGATVYEGA
jgi:hypothetical protein